MLVKALMCATAVSALRLQKVGCGGVETLCDLAVAASKAEDGTKLKCKMVGTKEEATKEIQVSFTGEPTDSTAKYSCDTAGKDKCPLGDQTADKAQSFATPSDALTKGLASKNGEPMPADTVTAIKNCVALCTAAPAAEETQE